MAGSTFKTNPHQLQEFLRDCEQGQLQLPDFQRSWVWDKDRINSLIASVSRAFPIGALMTLETGGTTDFGQPPSEWSALKYGFEPTEDGRDGNEEAQAGSGRGQAAAGGRAGLAGAERG